MATIQIDKIVVSDRLRQVDEDWVHALSVSIAQNGLLEAVTVGKKDMNHGTYRLIAGAHRLAACKALGHQTIEARVFEGNELEQRLAEIDENLLRRELNVIDRAAFLAERRSICASLQGGKKPLGNEFPKGLRETVQYFPVEGLRQFDVLAARKMRVSDRHIRNFVAIHYRLAPDVRQRLSTSPWADKLAELTALSKLAAADQRAVTDKLLAAFGGARSVRDALAQLGKGPKPSQPQDKAKRALIRAWAAASHNTRRVFLLELEESGELTHYLGTQIGDEPRVMPLVPNELPEDLPEGFNPVRSLDELNELIAGGDDQIRARFADHDGVHGEVDPRQTDLEDAIEAAPPESSDESGEESGHGAV